MTETLKLIIAALVGSVSLIVITRKKEPECPTWLPLYGSLGVGLLTYLILSKFFW